MNLLLLCNVLDGLGRVLLTLIILFYQKVQRNESNKNKKATKKETLLLAQRLLCLSFTIAWVNQSDKTIHFIKIQIRKVLFGISHILCI